MMNKKEKTKLLPLLLGSNIGKASICHTERVKWKELAIVAVIAGGGGGLMPTITKWGVLFIVLVPCLYLYVLDEKIRELLALVQELTVGSLLCDPAVLHDHDSVHHGEVLHPVGHQETGLVLQQAGGSDNLDSESDNPIIDRLLFGQIIDNLITDKPKGRKQNSGNR